MTATIEVVDQGRLIAFSFDGRYRVDKALARPERGRTLERFVFRLSYRESGVTLVLLSRAE